MPLEVAAYISQLDPANPTATDPKNQGDDHLRLVKSVLKTTFPNINAAMNASDEELNYLVGLTIPLQARLNLPAFSVYKTLTQAIPASTWTKITFGAETFDTNSCYDNVNFKFQPNVAGYYHLSLSVSINFTTDQGYINPALWLNGGINAGSLGTTNSINSFAFSTASRTIFFNGTTDYVEGYVYQVNASAASKNIDAGPINTVMFGHFLRGA